MVKQAILKGNIDEAVAQLEALPVSTGQLEELQLLHYQFVEWNKRERLGMTPEISERNRIVYGLICLASQIESEINSVDANINEFETYLKQGYSNWIQLNQRGLLDLFLQWVFQFHPTLFDRVKQIEKRPDGYPYHQLLYELPLVDFIQRYQVAHSLESLQIVLANSFKGKPALFSSWYGYTLKRRGAQTELAQSIRKVEKRYFKALKSLGIGLAGGLLGAGIIEVIRQEMPQEPFGEVDDELDGDF